MSVGSTVVAQMPPFWPGALFGLMALFMLAILVVVVLVAVWVYRDAESRGMNGAIWLLIVLLTNILGLIVYVVIREDHPKTGNGGPFCPSCGRRAEPGDRHCRDCGQALGDDRGPEA